MAQQTVGISSPLIQRQANKFMNNYREQYPSLTYAISPYFHQDWVAEYYWSGSANWETVVRQFMAENEPEKIKQAVADLEKFLSLPLNDEEIDKIVQYDFTTSGFMPLNTGRAFLRRVLEILKEASPKEPPLIRK